MSQRVPVTGMGGLSCPAAWSYTLHEHPRARMGFDLWWCALFGGRVPAPTGVRPPFWFVVAGSRCSLLSLVRTSGRKTGCCGRAALRSGCGSARPRNPGRCNGSAGLGADGIPRGETRAGPADGQACVLCRPGRTRGRVAGPALSGLRAVGCCGTRVRRLPVRSTSPHRDFPLRLSCSVFAACFRPVRCRRQHLASYQSRTDHPVSWKTTWSVRVTCRRSAQTSCSGFVDQVSAQSSEALPPSQVAAGTLTATKTLYPFWIEYLVGVRATWLSRRPVGLFRRRQVWDACCTCVKRVRPRNMQTGVQLLLVRHERSASEWVPAPADTSPSRRSRPLLDGGKP